ncbi:MAG: protein kinase domain-containing protein [Myxococcota bacterium]
MVRLMFVDKSRPLADSGVRFPDGEAAEYQTDDEGRIQVELDAGDYRVEVETGDGWVEREFTVDGESNLVVIDLRDSRPNVRQTRQYFDTGGGRELGDRYEFLGELGRGGMGVVVRARDTLLNRDVAIKILTPELQGSSEAERIFLTEARSMAKLSHANLVAVHDVISEDGHSMMVVEFITGKNLEELIRAKGSLSQKAVINIGIQVCRVIDYLHSEGVIHRDLKPANLMIEGDGKVKLIDFGLARSLEQIAHRGTKIRGTPAYMAPEQVLGDDLSAATDIYQIGVTLFEALTGELPFAKGDVAYQHVHKEPPTTEATGNNIFPALAELVDSCLAKDPTERPESAKMLMEELQAVKQILTSGRISAVQLSESGISRDSAGQPASTPQPADISGTTGAATGGGSLPEVSADGPPEEIVGSHAASPPAASGPARWLWPALAALFLVAVGAVFFGNTLVGGQSDQDAARDKAKAEADPAERVAPEREPSEPPSEPDAGDEIEAARAVSSAGQVVQSANAAARTVVEWGPGGSDAPPKRQKTTGGAKSEASPSKAQRSAPSEDATKDETASSQESGSEGAEVDAPETVESIQKLQESVPDEETREESEAESPTTASSDAETEPDEVDEPQDEDSAEAAQPSGSAGAVSDSDSGSSRQVDETPEEKSDEKDKAESEKQKREERSAPVSF